MVGEAASWFNADETARFAQCFAEDATIYWELDVSDAPAITSREQLEVVIARVRSTFPESTVQLGAVREFGGGLVADTIIVTDVVWRLALAVLCSADQITEVRAFRDSQAAEAWLSKKT